MANSRLIILSTKTTSLSVKISGKFWLGKISKLSLKKILTIKFQVMQTLFLPFLNNTIYYSIHFILPGMRAGLQRNKWQYMLPGMVLLSN